MEFHYEILGSGENVNCFYKLSGEEVEKLGKGKCLETKVPVENLVSEKMVKLRMSIPDNDTDFELHHHPSDKRWINATEIHSTIGPNGYSILREKGKFTSKHDYGLVEIVHEYYYLRADLQKNQ